MKIYLNKPGCFWISPYTILAKIIFWRDIKMGYTTPLIEKIADRLLPISTAIDKFMNKVFTVNYVKIDKWDTWSMDFTLALLIVPMLKQLKATKHGAPFVDDSDVPEHLASTAAPLKQNEWDTDDNHFKRWDWVLSEMIWTFEQIADPESEFKFYTFSEATNISDAVKNITCDREGLKVHEDRITNGLRLFGKYYRSLWD